MLVVHLGQGSCPYNSGTLSECYRNAVRMLQERCPRLARIIISSLTWLWTSLSVDIGIISGSLKSVTDFVLNHGTIIGGTCYGEKKRNQKKYGSFLSSLYWFWPAEVKYDTQKLKTDLGKENDENISKVFETSGATLDRVDRLSNGDTLQLTYS